jgi:hypothetical protein
MRKMLVLMMIMILSSTFFYSCKQEETDVCISPYSAYSMEEYFEDLMKAYQGETDN